VDGKEEWFLKRRDLQVLTILGSLKKMYIVQSQMKRFLILKSLLMKKLVEKKIFTDCEFDDSRSKKERDAATKPRGFARGLGPGKIMVPQGAEENGRFSEMERFQ
jgi:hypothetical protein